MSPQTDVCCLRGRPLDGGDWRDRTAKSAPPCSALVLGALGAERGPVVQALLALALEAAVDRPGVGPPGQALGTVVLPREAFLGVVVVAGAVSEVLRQARGARRYGDSWINGKAPS